MDRKRKRKKKEIKKEVKFAFDLINWTQANPPDVTSFTT